MQTHTAVFLLFYFLPVNNRKPATQVR